MEYCGLSIGWSVGLSVKMAEPIDMWFRMWVQITTHEGAILRAGQWSAHDMYGSQCIQSNSAGGSTGMVRMPTGCTRCGSRWHNLANTTESSACGCDAALRYSTLTACFDRHN